jgi:hypothetical protein
LEGDQAYPLYGLDVAAAGEVYGDGYADVMVGAPGESSPESDEGAAFVFVGSASGIASVGAGAAATRLESNQTGAVFGLDVAGAGDVNGDGYADVIVGAPSYDAGESDEGAAFVFLGGASGVATGTAAAASARIESDQAGALLGASVAGAGDVDADGYADVIVLAPGYDDGQSNEGLALVVRGTAAGIANSTPLSVGVSRITSDQAEASAPSLFFSSFDFQNTAVAGAGDVNGDGYADVIVGFSLYDTGSTNQGIALLFLGGASGIPRGGPGAAAARLEPPAEANAYFGHAVAGAGDVNGDGFADVVVGAARGHPSFPSVASGAFDDFATDEGAAFVFLGSPGARPAGVQQRRGDGSGIAVQPWGASPVDGFAVEAIARHPEGTGRVALEVEACPAGVPFADATCAVEVTSWTDVDGVAPDELLSHTFSGLGGSLYRWRARVLHAPTTGVIPVSPEHGPWRRLEAQSAEGDVRVAPEPGAGFVLALGVATLLGLRARARGSVRRTRSRRA